MGASCYLGEKQKFKKKLLLQQQQQVFKDGPWRCVMGNTLKRGVGNVNKVGKCLPSICLHLEPVMIFAVSMFLHFLIEQTQHGEMGKWLLTVCSLILRRGNMYDYFRI